MLRSLRSLSLVSVLAIAVAPPLSAQAQEAFEEGVRLLNEGQDEEALAAFRRVLVEDPSNEEAYALWIGTDQATWTRILLKGGEFEQIGEQLIDRARLGRRERVNDPERIKELLQRLATEDVSARKRATLELSATYGEYAVAPMLFALADRKNDERRVQFMLSLTQMGSVAVRPLIAALDAPDPFLRRNVALTLGRLRDPRANGALAMIAASDPDDGARAAAEEALRETGGSTDALGQLLALGREYENDSPTVLAPYQRSDVVWIWEGNGIQPIEVPPDLLNEELAKRSYFRALRVSPGSSEALRGAARAVTAERAYAETLGEIPEDARWVEELRKDELAVRLAGPEAFEGALEGTTADGDDLAAELIARILGEIGPASPAALEAALGSSTSGAVRGRAATSLAAMACDSGAAASPDVVSALVESATRAIVRLVAIVDADDARRNALTRALEERGVLVNPIKTGAGALYSLRALPGLDVVLLAETLPDIPAPTVLSELRRSPRWSEVPVILVTRDAESAADLWGDRVAGMVTSAEELSAVDEALTRELNADRQAASDLAVDSATVLEALAKNGRTDLTAAAAPLAGALDRPDAVTVPALGVLQRAGGAAEAHAVAAVLADEARSDEVRKAAAEALAGILQRTGAADARVVTALRNTILSEASYEIRLAAATALGRAGLDPRRSAEIMSGLRSGADQERQ